jgi:hypothetical protein
MRGSRPGERRGGRQKGTPNRKTAYVRAVMAAHAAQDNVSPLDLILAVMREPHVALGQRVNMALKALPHLHAKAKAGQPDELGDDWAKPDNGSTAGHVNAHARAAAEKVNQELMPLDFLQSVIRDARTPAALQIKVAQVIIPYIRPKRSLQPTAGDCCRPVWLCRRSRMTYREQAIIFCDALPAEERRLQS